ncbi:MAG: nucleotide exchange factor GrpE [Actinomycetota bacterium]|nr:nucleotide exchange factor GrpE [Actinomycetota bacterium]
MVSEEQGNFDESNEPNDEELNEIVIEAEEIVANADEDNEDPFVQELRRERDEYLESLQRTKADFDNYRRRVARLEEESSEKRVLALIEKLIPVLDDLSMLLAHVANSDSGEIAEKTIRPMFAMLTNEGLEVIDSVEVAFDPEIHLAVVHEEGDGGPLVSEVLRPGYRWKGRVLRPAMVKVVG